jgi:hypothetical protein
MPPNARHPRQPRQGPQWDPDFDFYEGTIDDDDRCLVTIDLGARRAAPLRSHPVRLQIRVEMHHPLPDGLRAPEESDALFALEDRVVERMGAAAAALYVGRTVAQGFTELFFYVPPGKRATADNPPAVVGDVAPYRLEWVTEEDPGWEKYLELYPNVYALQTIMNRRLVRHMREGGDQLDVPREIDHVVDFPNGRKARAAAAALRRHRFRVDPLTPPRRNGAEWRLEFHREDRCDGSRPDQFVFEILEIVVPQGGDYGGWSAPVQKG